jgi:hypothetical protein
MKDPLDNGRTAEMFPDAQPPTADEKLVIGAALKRLGSVDKTVKELGSGWGAERVRFVCAALQDAPQVTVPQVTEAPPPVPPADALFRDYLNYVTAIFRPGDTLCFVAIEHNLDGDREQESIVNEFVSYEEAITRGAFDELTRANNTTSRNPRNTKSSIYVATNTFHASLIGQKTGRTQENVVAVRAVQADVDYNGAATMDAIKSSDLVPPPSIVVESSPGKFQGIWLVDDIAREHAKPLMQAIAATFNTDKAVAEIARVMRVPGFINRKYESAPVAHTVMQTNTRYHREDFKVGMPQQSEKFEQKNPDGWVNEIRLQHGQIYNQLVKLAGYYVRQHNADDPEVLYRLLASHCETAVDRDGVSKFHCNMNQVRGYAEKWAKEFETKAAYEARTRLKLNQQPTAQPAHAQEQANRAQAASNNAPGSFPQGEWAELRQIEGKLTPVLPFLPEYLPEAVRLWCMDVAERMSLPLDFTGIAALTVISGAIGRRAFVFPKAFDKKWKESIALSGALVADSGKKKTPVWKMMINPLVELEMKWRAQYAKDMKAYTTLYKDWERDYKKGDATADEEPEKPICRRAVFTDCTPEALHAALEHNAEGVLYFRDELTSWVEELEQEGRQSQRGIFLCGMNGNDVYPLDRIGRGAVYATMCIGVGGNFQPELLRNFLSDNRNIEDGLVQRFGMIVWPNEAKLPRVDRPASYNEAAYRTVIHTLANLKYDKGKDTSPVELHFDAEAQKLFNGWDEQREDRMYLERRSGMKSSLSKYSGMMPKAAALFQLIDLARGGGALGGTYYIDAHHTKMAISLFQYLESHLNRIHSSAFEPWQTAEFVIAKNIAEGTMPDGMTARDIKRKWNATKNMLAEDIEMALENLQEHGWVRHDGVKPKGPGRPTTVWYVNPLAKGKDVYKAVTIAPAIPVALDAPVKPVVAVKTVILSDIEEPGKVYGPEMYGPDGGLGF